MPEVSTKPLTRRERSIAAKYRRLLKAEDRASIEYQRADRIALAIAQQLGGHGKQCRISAEGKGIRVVEPIKAAIEKAEPDEMPKAWAHGSVRQFKIDEVKLVTA